MRFKFFSKICILSFLILGCSIEQKFKKINIDVVKNFNSEKYLGDWYEIARLPNNFEEKCKNNVKANYTLKGDFIIVKNECLDKDYQKIIAIGKAYLPILDEGRLKISFFRPFYSNYNIIELDENYTYALVSGDTEEFMWILSRSKTIDRKILKRLVKKAKELGFDTSRIIYTKQI